MRLCVNDGCKNEAIFDTNICEDCLASSAHNSQRSFGLSDVVLCGHCMRWISVEDIPIHAIGTKEGDAKTK